MCESGCTGRPANQIRLAWASPDAIVARMRRTQPEAVEAEQGPDSMLGDVRALAEQAGAGAEWSLAALVPNGGTSGLPALRTFVEGYAATALTKREWPAVLEAWNLARQGMARELIVLDREWAGLPQCPDLEEASYRVGRRQLNKLRPLRHERVIQRYASAVDEGRARGWHPLVYGLTLAVFNLPLRQGLMNYGAQTLTGFVTAAEHRHGLAADECQRLLDEVIRALPAGLPPLAGPALAVGSPGIR